MINISEEYASWNNRLKVELSKKTENQSEWVERKRERAEWSEVPFKCPRGESVLPREQAWAGTLKGFHLKENVKYPLKQLTKAKYPKEPDMTPTWQSWHSPNWCHSTASTSPRTISDMLNTLEAASEELLRQERWPGLTQVSSVQWQISNRWNFQKAREIKFLFKWMIWGSKSQSHW